MKTIQEVLDEYHVELKNTNPHASVYTCKKVVKKKPIMHFIQSGNSSTLLNKTISCK
jgi:hypothetical protein